jgi:hypothetical protein
MRDGCAPVPPRLGIEKVERIRGSRVLGQGIIRKARFSRRRVEHDILEHRCEVLRRAVNFRLRLRREPNRLGVRPALEIEDAALGPSMLVITDEAPPRNGRQRRFPGSR